MKRHYVVRTVDGYITCQNKKQAIEELNNNDMAIGSVIYDTDDNEKFLAYCSKGIII